MNNEWFLIGTALWSLPWKGVALWKSSRKSQKVWFIVLLVVNTFALLEIIYIFFGDQLNALFKKWRGPQPKKGSGDEK